MVEKITVLAIPLFFAIQGLTQTSVPDAVASAFQQNFPSARAIEWEEEEQGIFEVDFKQNKQKHSASFDASGKWLATETEIKKSALPDAVRQSINKTFSGYELDEAEKVETPDGLAYEVELEKEEGDAEIEVEALFSADGKLLKQSKAEEEEEDD